jgi:hypothetical protein
VIDADSFVDTPNGRAGRRASEGSIDYDIPGLSDVRGSCLASIRGEEKRDARGR